MFPNPDLPPVDTASGFFFFELPKNVEELIAYNAQLRTYKDRLFEKDIIPPCHLELTEQWLPYTTKHFTLEHPLGKRAIPELILHPAVQQLDALQLVLTNPLEAGELKWSQVWQGTLSSRLAPQIMAAPIVIKIYQESLFPCWPQIADVFGEGNDWRPGALTAALEAYAFDQLSFGQGGMIPWSYGFYKVILPNGEKAFAHMMELIDGILASSPEANIEKLGLSDADIWKLADEMGMALHQIHSRGFIHGDIKGSNVMLVNTARAGHDSDIHVVLLDFGLILVLSEDIIPPKYIDVRKMHDAGGIGKILEDMGVSSETFASWNNGRRADPPAWRTMFAYIDSMEDLYGTLLPRRTLP